MSAATALTLSPVLSAENLQTLQRFSTPGHTTTNHNNNHSSSTYSNYYSFPYSDLLEGEPPRLLHKKPASHSRTNSASGRYTSATPTEDTVLLEKATISGSLLHKSNSYSGTIRPKATILKQDSVNGRIATSLTDNESDYGSVKGSGSYGGASALAGDGTDEDEPFLVTSSDAVGNDDGLNGSGGNGGGSSRRGARSHGKSRASICLRAHAFLNRNWYLSYLVPLSILLALMFVAYITRDYAKRLLYWIETQNPWVIFALFMLLFVVVSFPVVVGYFVLMITAGYLFGFLKGLLTVILGANMGIAIAHVVLRSFRHRIPMQRLIKNETGRAILRVISGPRAFKVVLFTRLTPIPFGIQNAIFGVSSINPRIYHSATFLGLLPAQIINVYLGSTLRSMHEVLNNHGTALTGYITFGVEVVCGVALMFWVVQKARKELSETLLSETSGEGKLIDIQV